MSGKQREADPGSSTAVHADEHGRVTARGHRLDGLRCTVYAQQQPDATWTLFGVANELKRGLPGPTPPPPAAMFIHADIVITCGAEGVSTPLVTALWVPDAPRCGGW